MPKMRRCGTLCTLQSHLSESRNFSVGVYITRFRSHSAIPSLYVYSIDRTRMVLVSNAHV